MIIHVGNRPSSLERMGREYFKRYTLIAPLAPSEKGCKPSVYRRCNTLAPSNTKFLSRRTYFFQIINTFILYYAQLFVSLAFGLRYYRSEKLK